jgi:hypothetical protein
MESLQNCAKELKKSIKKPYDIHEIINFVNSGEYSADLILHHLIIWVAELDRDLQNPETVEALMVLGKIARPIGPKTQNSS